GCRREQQDRCDLPWSDRLRRRRDSQRLEATVIPVLPSDSSKRLARTIEGPDRRIENDSATGSSKPMVQFKVLVTEKTLIPPADSPNFFRRPRAQRKSVDVEAGLPGFRHFPGPGISDTES